MFRSRTVCGCNIQTYSNECYARKAGVTSYVMVNVIKIKQSIQILTIYVTIKYDR